MSRKPFEPGGEVKPRDLVRVTDPKHAHVVSFARVYRVQQAWLEFVPGEFGARTIDCERVSRPADNNEDFGFVALPESQLKRLWRMADAAGDPVAATLHDELERIERLPWRHERRDAC